MLLNLRERTRIVTPPYLLKKIFGELTWEFPTSEKVIYLTFDDGPVPGVTDWVLDLLDEYNAKGTFFCLGKNVSKSPALFEDLLSRGHTVGNHGYNHLNGWHTRTDLYVEDALKFDEAYKSEFFRPPYGKLRPTQIKKLKDKYRIIMWSVISYDFDPEITIEKCLSNVTDNCGPGSIVVFHDSKKAEMTMKAVLPKVLQRYASEGYRFEKI